MPLSSSCIPDPVCSMRKHIMKYGFVAMVFCTFSTNAQTFEISEAEVVYDKSCKSEYTLCKGQINWKDGSNYRGDLKGGAPNGWGILKCNKKSTYTGEFLKGIQHGRGQKYFDNGDSYSGEWKKGKMHGKGVYNWKDGFRFIGLFENGELKGFGTLELPDGSVFRGSWENSLTQILEKDGIENLDPSVLYDQSALLPLGHVFIGKSRSLRNKKTVAFQIVNGKSQVFIWKHKVISEKPDEIFLNNQHFTGQFEDLYAISEKNRKIGSGFILLWYTLGQHHLDQKNQVLSKKNFELSLSFTKVGTKIHNIIWSQVRQIENAVD